MSRQRLYLRSLGVGYGALAANIAYSLISIPLALRYLGKEQFGLWAVVLQIVGYLQLLDFGISNGISRILVDEKDNRETGTYGSVLQTGFIAQCAIGAAVALAGWLSGPFSASLFSIPENLSHDFVLLIGIQSTITGISIAGRILGAPFDAYQRQDLVGYQTIGLFVVYLATLWLGLQKGWGLYSMVFSLGSGLIWTFAAYLFFDWKLKLLPRGREWGRPSMARFREIFKYSRELFLMTLGWQILNGSPILVISRSFGLDAAANWSICIKPFQILSQFIARPLDFSIPGLSEMYVRQEIETLRRRARELFQFTAAFAGAACAVMAVINPSFVALWTHGRIQWPLENHWTMAFMIFVYSIFRISNGFVGVTKDIRWLKYSYFLEGLIFVGICLALSEFLRIAWIPILAGFCHLLITAPLGIRYFSKDLGFHPSETLAWLWRPAIGFLLLIGCGVSVTALPEIKSGVGILDIAIQTTLIGIPAAAITWFVSLSTDLRVLLARLIQRKISTPVSS